MHETYFFLFGRKLFGFLLPNSMSKDIRDNWSCESRIVYSSWIYRTENLPKGTGKGGSYRNNSGENWIFIKYLDLTSILKNVPSFYTDILNKYINKISLASPFSSIFIAFIFSSDWKLLERIVYPKSLPVLIPEWLLPLVTHKSPLTSISKCLMIMS